jgi:hypothetical protein
VREARPTRPLRGVPVRCLPAGGHHLAASGSARSVPCGDRCRRRVVRMGRGRRDQAPPARRRGVGGRPLIVPALTTTPSGLSFPRTVLAFSGPSREAHPHTRGWLRDGHEAAPLRSGPWWGRLSHNSHSFAFPDNAASPLRSERVRRALRALLIVLPALITLLTVGGPSAVAQANEGPSVQPVQTPDASSQLPCNIYAAAGTPCAAALSTVRALYAGYDGPLYKVERASDGTTRNVGVLGPGGYADANTQTAFCLHTTCSITEIYDQSPEGNNLYVEGAGGNGPADRAAPANALPVSAGGEEVYGVEGWATATTTQRTYLSATSLRVPTW